MGNLAMPGFFMPNNFYQAANNNDEFIIKEAK